MFVAWRLRVSFVACVLISLESNGLLRFRVLTSHGVLRCLCPDVLKVHGVLRLRVLMSHGVLCRLCPDVPEVQWRPSSSCPDVSWCPSLFVS